MNSENTQAFLGLEKRDNPCERCGWRYAGFHVCFDASKQIPEEGGTKPKKRQRREHITEAQRLALEEGSSERWARHREENRRRDEEIIKKYKQGNGLRSLSREYGIAYQTAMGIIRREEAVTGETIMRPVGRNARFDKVQGAFS